MLRSYLASLIICQHGYEREDVGFWEKIYLESDGPGTLTNELLAYDRTKERLQRSRRGNPLNVIALLIYNISNTGNLDKERKVSFVSSMETRERITDLDSIQEGIDLVESLYHTHLSRDQVSKLVGHEVNLDRVATMVREEYEKLRGN